MSYVKCVLPLGSSLPWSLWQLLTSPEVGFGRGRVCGWTGKGGPPESGPLGA